MRRLLLILATVLLAGLPSAAIAQQYPPEEDDAQVSDSSVPPGGQTTISGGGCAPASPVNVAFDGEQAASGTADGGGSFAVLVTVPSDATSGTHSLTATCTGTDGAARVLGAQITVEGETARGGTGGGALPATGSDSSLPLTQVAIALVVFGALMVIATRRRSYQLAEK